jgi:lisH domain-containing protein FOPNL
VRARDDHELSAAAAAAGPHTLTTLLPLATPNKTHTALRAQLERTGAWSKLRARVRAEVVVCGGGGGTGVAAPADDEQAAATAPTPDPDTFFINELIREYLTFHGLRDTLSVFLPETGQPAMALRPLDHRAQLEAETGAGAASAASSRLPLLYSLLGRARKAGGLQ